MKIYTKTGDLGQTSLLGGSRVPKSHIRVETYGTVDEVNAHIAHLKDLLQANNFSSEYIGILHRVNKDLFDIGSLLALENDSYRGKIAEFDPDSIALLEMQIDSMEEVLPKLRDFILPGGHPHISQCHIARTVCRRAERCMVALSETHPVEPHHIRYINRLSDYLFVLARYIAKEYGVVEDKWHE